MASKKRKGSSTRKHKIIEKHAQQATIPFSKKEKKAASSNINTEEKQRRVLGRLYEKLRSGLDTKGKPLTDDEIGKTLTAIGNLEQKLGIVHKE